MHIYLSRSTTSSSVTGHPKIHNNAPFFLCHSQHCCATAGTVVSQPVLLCHSQHCCATASTVVPQPALLCHSQHCCAIASTVVPQPALLCHSQHCCAIAKQAGPYPHRHLHAPVSSLVADTWTSMTMQPTLSRCRRSLTPLRLSESRRLVLGATGSARRSLRRP